MKPTLSLACRLLLMLLALVLWPMSVSAQEQQSVKIKGNVVLYNTFEKKNLPPERLWFGIFRKDEGERVKEEINRVSGSAKKDDVSAELRVAEEVNKLRKKYKIVEKTSARGNFEKNVLSGMALVFVTSMDSKAEILYVKDGQLEYNDFVIKVERVPEVVRIGEERERDVIGGGITGDPDDGNEYFPVHLVLTKGNARTDSRFIIQTYAVDCQTEDTMDYCLPIVYEGAMYHHMQEKRMAFNYEEHDKLARGYDPSVVLDENQKIVINTVVKYKKPEHMKKRTFKGPFKYSIEDFHHVYSKGGWDGTCLRERPFKFLDFSPALAQLELSEEFYVEAASNVENKKQDLNLTFEVGKDILTTDSMNQVQLNNLIKELQSYGNSLVSPNVMGAASPDGSRVFNEKLARQRAQKAASMIQPHLPGGVRVSTNNVKIYTWSDVIEELKRKGRDDEAAQMQAVIDRGGSDESLYGAMRQLPFYEFSIEPILRSMRKMRCTYQFIRDHIMTPQECLDEYYKNKQQYINGSKTFSNGDYYNLFSQITDSLELDILTQLAYNHIIRYDHYWEENAMAPYIANRMALMNLRRGTPNPQVLDPFIDYRRKAINASKFIDDMLTIKINRQEIVTNQAVTYYQEQKLDSAMYLIQLVEAAGVNDPNIVMLKHYMDLKRLHFLRNSRTPQQEQDYNRAKNIVLSASDDNKAILYTEIKDWDMREQADRWVNMMDDGDPKKWYLKALLAVDNAGKDAPLYDDGGIGGDSSEQRDSIGGGFVALTEDEYYDLQARDPVRAEAYMKQKYQYMQEHDGQFPEPKPAASKTEVADDGVSMDGIPNYLAYFQGAFDIEPAYKRMYASEGQVSEELRRKYKYKKKNIPAYRKMFAILKRQDNQKRQQALEAQGAGEGMDMMDEMENAAHE